MDSTEDLRAFERRMMEIVSSLRPSIWRWRITLFMLSSFTIFTFCLLITGIRIPWIFWKPNEKFVSGTSQSSTLIFILNLCSCEVFFGISLTCLLFVFVCGIHRKLAASSIITSRLRCILHDYNMSCDDNGRLILKSWAPENFIRRS